MSHVDGVKQREVGSATRMASAQHTSTVMTLPTGPMDFLHSMNDRFSHGKIQSMACGTCFGSASWETRGLDSDWSARK